jgi:alpha-maltose-1-phosphate synthase
MSDEPQILVATDGPPRGRATWSGSSARLCAALEGRGALAGAVDVKPRVLDLAEKAASVSRRPAAWRQRYRSSSSPLSPVIRGAMTVVGARRARAAAPAPDAVLQISGWYDVTRAGGPSPRLRVTYQDANVALWRRRPDIVLDPRAGALRRTERSERRVYDRLDLILTMSEWARRSFIEDFGQSPEKVVAVGAGANLDAVPSAPDGREMDVPRLLFVGRKWERKGGPQLLEAFRVLRERHPDAELWIVGPPPRDGEPGVSWFGPIFRDTPEGAARLDELFRAATAFVMPSLYEGFGIPFLEGMAYALPCVGTDTCAIPETVEDGVTGMLVAPGDARALAERLLELAADPARARALGAAGRERFVERYTWDRVAERICTVVRER